MLILNQLPRLRSLAEVAIKATITTPREVEEAITGEATTTVTTIRAIMAAEEDVGGVAITR